MYQQSEKVVKQQYLLHMSPQRGKLRPTGGWDHFGSLGHASKFQRVSRVGFVTAATSLTGGQPNVLQCLAVGCLVHYTYIICNYLYIHYGILPGANFTLRPSLAFLYIGSVTARHCTSRRQPNFAAWYTEWNYETFANGAICIRLSGHQVGHRPTF